jgi:hypothetical protein
MPSGLKLLLEHFMKSVIDSCVVVTVFTVISTRPAYAYLDPGSASLIIQGIIGTIAAAGFVFRSYLYKFMAMIRGKSAEEKTTDQKD